MQHHATGPWTLMFLIPEQHIYVHSQMEVKGWDSQSLNKILVANWISEGRVLLENSEQKCSQSPGTGWVGRFPSVSYSSGTCYSLRNSTFLGTSLLFIKQRPSKSPFSFSTLETLQDLTSDLGRFYVEQTYPFLFLLLGVSIISFYVPWHKSYLLCCRNWVTKARYPLDHWLVTHFLHNKGRLKTKV